MLTIQESTSARDCVIYPRSEFPKCCRMGSTVASVEPVTRIVTPIEVLP